MGELCSHSQQVPTHQIFPLCKKSINQCWWCWVAPPAPPAPSSSMAPCLRKDSLTLLLAINFLQSLSNMWWQNIWVPLWNFFLWVMQRILQENCSKQKELCLPSWSPMFCFNCYKKEMSSMQVILIISIIYIIFLIY